MPANWIAATERPASPRSGHPSALQQLITLLLIVGPVAALGVAVARLWRHGLSPLECGLAVGFYLVAGHGVTVGFHRYLTHRSFTANRSLRIALAVAGCLAVEGGPIGWVAAHRRHHQFSDGPGDPHSPYRFGTGLFAQLRGFAHAHIGWMVTAAPTDPHRYAPDLIAEPDLRAVDRLFPVIAMVSVTAPFFIGLAVTGRVTGGLGALLWAGLVRVGVLHHVTWSVNSVCHMVGRRPFRTRGADRAGNVRALAVLSMGESWHNAHHADPSCARHGVDRFQLDSSARLIRWFELIGWARDVHWPDPRRFAHRRMSVGTVVGRPSSEFC